MKENIISSVKNEHIKYLSKLKQKKYRDEYGLYLIEGIKIINEAVNNNELLAYIIFDDRYNHNLIKAEKSLYVTENVLKSISGLKSPPGIIAAVRKKQKKVLINSDKWVFLDDIKDPSNAAAIVRSADCAGFDGVAFSEGSVDEYNDKFLRACMGSNYHISIVSFQNKDTGIDYFRQKGYYIIGADLAGEEKINIINEKILLIIGNESSGISENILRKCDCKIKIPIYGKAESLNAACAASVLMYMINGYIKRY